TLKMPAFEWVHVQLHQQKGMISLSPPTICNSASSAASSLSEISDRVSQSRAGRLSDVVGQGAVCSDCIMEKDPAVVVQ
ncbi:hypothetical protein, partial [Escherichia coli]|uniref:hypothetical protein n=1 Tax=Escherichia coli TaxID=562 RepID=UPI001BC8F27C